MDNEKSKSLKFNGEFNLNNSNLKHSVNSNSSANLKNSSNLQTKNKAQNSDKTNQRDYDKNPIILQDYSDEMLGNGLLSIGILLLIYKFLCFYGLLEPVTNRMISGNNFLISPVGYAMVFYIFFYKI